VIEYGYDAENRLVSVSAGEMQVSFLYDGDGQRVASLIDGEATVYIGEVFEWDVTDSSMTRYYYAGAQRVAVRLENASPVWLLGDHLGSTSVAANPDGSLLSRQGYLPWGELRFTEGSLPGRYQFTGQASYEAEFGLYYYKARWYDPHLGRFSQPDSMVPDAGNPLDWDRYAYVRNNPAVYTDLSGHKPCTPTSDGTCDPFEEMIIKLLDEIENAARKSVQDKDNDGYPETPDAHATPVKAQTISSTCTQSTYVECYYARSLLDSPGWLSLDKKQMALLTWAVYYDLNSRSRSPSDRMNYDTPMWDGLGRNPGNICYGGQCFPRQEVNYFAQGMYSAADGDERWRGLATVYAWKLFMYQEIPSTGTLFWFDFGYFVFLMLDGR
jgi:RHS repeat-associated protein